MDRTPGARAADLLELVDAGDDLVARGDVRGPVGPALGPLPLSAAEIRGIPGTVTWAGQGGVPGEGTLPALPGAIGERGIRAASRAG
ncbi:hypothetical protein [Streptomyces sp. NBC_01435]|uniref:hypothetical protein n=1 Tax=Streptomyces sp. NBC_01435 TaxID=2903865 RepID=UPI002E341137|nr:hypothetical protein [Streptomyces sp. NBC_01435]